MSADILTRMREHVNKHKARERAMFTVAGVMDLLAHIESLETRLRDTEANSELRLRMLIEANDELEAYRAAALAAREATR